MASTRKVLCDANYAVAKSRKLTRVGYDIEKYDEFVREQADRLIERGVNPKTAMDQAREIASMYRHHFRIWE